MADHTCSISDCTEKPHCRGRCRRHYTQWLKANAAPCSFPDCGRPIIARGLCGGHYQQQAQGRELTPLVEWRVAKTEQQRFDWFWSRVDAGGVCWEWQGTILAGGYGSIGMKGYRKSTAHRVAWEMLVGPIPDGLTLDHLCFNRRCVNPDHLEPVTQAENNRRSRWNAAHRHRAKTHCPQGHPYDEVNTYISPSGKGGRTCRACREQRQLELKARRTSAPAA